MRNFLVIRLSSLGDVALTVPVLQAVCSQNANIKITLLTRKNFKPLFRNIPNISFIDPDLKGKHKGLPGLFRLYREIRGNNSFEAVVDLHDVLRSKILRSFFRISGLAVYKIHKGRKEKKALTRTSNKILLPLTSTTDRYAEVFRKAGLAADPGKSEYLPGEFPTTVLVNALLGKKNQAWIGIAPFAQHKEKMYPIEKMKEVIRLLTAEGKKIFIFGGGPKEENIAGTIADGRLVISLVSKFSLEDELGIMQKMDVMLTMDSANMHLAGIAGVKVISIWGATHPYAGFLPFSDENKKRMIQISAEEMPCRPCSVFGNVPCHRGDFACMMNIAAHSIAQKVREELQ